MKVLFLDIDGVINSSRTYAVFNAYPHDLSERDLKMFDWVAIGLIRSLCTRGDVEIVLSSSWRLEDFYPKIGPALNLPIIDRTRSFSPLRGDEIQDWLDNHPNVTKYAIVDDLDKGDMLESQLPRFVKVDRGEGLTWSNYKALCDLFGCGIFDNEYQDDPGEDDEEY